MQSADVVIFSIDELHAVGLIDTWNKRWLTKSKCTPLETRPKVISLAHLQGALYAALGGVGCSALLLIVEHCFLFLEQRKGRASNKRTLLFICEA